MAEETQAKPESPPYISYTSFRNFVTSLQANGVPARIDKSVVRTMSGSAQSSLFAALKWLGLMDADGTPTPALEELVAANENAYPTKLKQLIEKRYHFLTDGSFPLGKASGSQVEAKFKEFGILGSTVAKCVAFFIAACRVAGIELSPHIKPPKAAKTNGATRKKKAAAPVENSPPPPPPQHPAIAQTPAAMLLAKFPDFDPAWSEEVRLKWFESFATLQGMMAKNDGGNR